MSIHPMFHGCATSVSSVEKNVTDRHERHSLRNMPQTLIQLSKKQSTNHTKYVQYVPSSMQQAGPWGHHQLSSNRVHSQWMEIIQSLWIQDFYIVVDAVHDLIGTIMFKVPRGELHGEN